MNTLFEMQCYLLLMMDREVDRAKKLTAEFGTISSIVVVCNIQTILEAIEA